MQVTILVEVNVIYDKAFNLDNFYTKFNHYQVNIFLLIMLSDGRLSTVFGLYAHLAGLEQRCVVMFFRNPLYNSRIGMKNYLTLHALSSNIFTDLLKFIRLNIVLIPGFC